jgi:hypothetical protein
MENKVLQFFIYVIIGCAGLWAIGSFITFDMLWFIHTWLGRLVAIVILLFIISGVGKEVYED